MLHACLKHKHAFLCVLTSSFTDSLLYIHTCILGLDNIADGASNSMCFHLSCHEIELLLGFQSPVQQYFNAMAHHACTN
jgi:hypothetical protein